MNNQREREAMKDERTHHDAMDKSLSEQQICDSTSRFCIARKNWAHAPTGSGSYSRLAGWQTKCM